MTAAVIALQGVGKRYTKYDDTPMLATAALRSLRSRTRTSQLWAVRGVDLEVAPGESVGVIGRNGAGKSTLLQLLGGVTAPTEGLLRVSGRVAPLISVGVGFHPELTGRENVFLNGTILGMTRREIERRFDDIVQFAELEEFIDTPVKFYSSGMFVRLGFSVAVEADPDVLLVDEVLAVGDLAFQVRSFERMQEIRSKGTTVVVVTHNLTAVRNLCPRTVLMHRGNAVFDGPSGEAISRFHDLLGEEGQGVHGPVDRSAVELRWSDIFDSTGLPTAHVKSGERISLRMEVCAQREIKEPFLGVNVVSQDGMQVYADTNLFAPTASLGKGEVATYEVDLAMPLATGSYGISAAFLESGERLGSAIELVRGREHLVYVAGRAMVHGVADLHAEFRRV